eukprot:m.53368 g.53368  ORF g.53368 m.53368 type:complete len:532 (-) comp13554_c0_seq1:73-1668(-)
MAVVASNTEQIFESQPVTFEHQMPKKMVPHLGKFELLSETTGLVLRWQHMLPDGIDPLTIQCRASEISSIHRQKDRITFTSERRGNLGPFVFASSDEISNLLTKLRSHGHTYPSRSQKSKPLYQHFTSVFSNLDHAFRKLVDVDSREEVVNLATYRTADDHDEAEDDWQDVYCRQSDDGFDLLDAEELPEPPPCERTEPVNLAQFQSFLEPDGRAVTSPGSLREAIFKGGLADDVRAMGWKFLLGQPLRSTAEEQADRAEQYNRIKQQWQSMTEKQVKNNYRMKDSILSINKDVPRTDRFQELYEDEDGPGLTAVHDVLMTYVVYNFDLGYVQGMNDLVAGLYYVLHDEAETFWCFCHWMEEQASLFAMEQKGMLDKLELLKTILQFVDPNLMAHLRDNESEHLLFCFRWLLVSFKREFHYESALYIWEVLWTQHLTTQFDLFICAALLCHHRDALLAITSAPDILKFVNGATEGYTLGQVQDILLTAEKLFWRLKQAPQQMPPELKLVLQTWEERPHEGVQSATLVDNAI